MKIAIIGSGKVGGNLGRVWSPLGHEIIFGVRDPQAPKVNQLLDEITSSARAETVDVAINSGEVVVLAVPWGAAERICRSADLSGKVLLDATNPIGPGFELAVGHTDSGAERIAGWAPGARVVKAFNTLGANHLVDPQLGERELTMLICGDDSAAKAVVSDLAAAIGFDVVDAGPLANARLLEPLAMLWIRLAMVEGLGRDIAFKLIRC